MTARPKNQRLGLVKQKRWLRHRGLNTGGTPRSRKNKIKDPVAAVMTALLVSGAKDARDVQEKVERVLLARQTLEKDAKDLDKEARILFKALIQARNLNEWIKGEAHVTLGLSLQEACGKMRRDPEAIAKTMFKDIPPPWLGLIRKIAGTRCPFCKQVIKEFT